MEQRQFAMTKLRQLRILYFRLFICVVISSIIIGLHYANFRNIEVASIFSIFEIPLLWLFCIGVQFAFFYADKIPIVKNWYGHLVRKIAEKERNSFENQFAKSRLLKPTDSDIE